MDIQAEIYEMARQIINQRARESYQRRKDVLTAKHVCGCGGMFSIQHKAAHVRTKRHAAWAATQK